MVESTLVKSYCNVMALQKGLNPNGHADNFQDAVLLEIPLPWKRNLYQEANPLPQQAIDLLALWLAEYRQTGQYPHRPLLIAPDAAYSREGYRRVMFYARTGQAFSAFDKCEYSVPVDEMGALLWAYFQAPQDLARFEAWRVPAADSIRDVLVCTHGTIDAACAKFGYPLYKHLREQHANDDLRVWRVSHFGGHVFAPTLMDMPTGHYWAYVEEAQAGQIVRQAGDVRALRGHYRGWAGLARGFLQAAECELWQRYGWEWFCFEKHGEIVLQDDATPPTWAEVRISYTHGDLRGVYEARVEVAQHIDTPNNTNDDHTLAFAQYRVCT